MDGITKFTRQDIIDLCAATRVTYCDQIQSQVTTLLRGTGNPRKLVLDAWEKLGTIKRFRGTNMGWDDNVRAHSQRMDRMIHIAIYHLLAAFPDFPIREASYLADTHDLPEAMHGFGDVPTHLKRRLSPHLAHLLDTIESRCFDCIAHVPDMRVLGIGNTSLSDTVSIEERKKLFLAYKKRREPWTHVVKYFDLLDAHLAAIYSLVHRREHCDADRCEKIVVRYRGWMEEILRDSTMLHHIQTIVKHASEARSEIRENFGENNPLYYHELRLFGGARHFFDLSQMTPTNTPLLRHWVRHMKKPYGKG